MIVRPYCAACPLRTDANADVRKRGCGESCPDAPAPFEELHGEFRFVHLLGSRVLRRKAREVTRADLPRVALIARALEVTRRWADGAGLSAPQIGFGLRVVNVDGTAMVNPRVLLGSPHKVAGIEGCLSVPGTYAKVERRDHVVVTYYDLAGEFQEESCYGSRARIVQHEVDHLDGILFIDRAKLGSQAKPYTGFSARIQGSRDVTVTCKGCGRIVTWDCDAIDEPTPVVCYSTTSARPPHFTIVQPKRWWERIVGQ